MGHTFIPPSPIEWVFIAIGILGVLALLAWRIKQYREKGHWIRSQKVTEIHQTTKDGAKVSDIMMTAVMARYDMPLPSKDPESMPEIYQVNN